LTEKPIGAKKYRMSMSKKNQLSDVLHKAIAESGLTLYRIAKDTGVVKTSLMRFMDGETSLRLDKADVLADYLGLALTKRKAKHE
jgi:plasmid maintenance system antidote protein VapI